MNQQTNQSSKKLKMFPNGDEGKVEKQLAAAVI
jgi:hypothetical protein